MTGPEVVATDDVLRLEDVEVGFPVRSGAFGRRSVLRAVDGVSLTVRRGTTFGLVGESGCGKTTLVRSILGLQKVNSGRVLLDGEDLTALGTRQLRSRRPKMQVVFQDPYSSLNEDLTVGDIVAEPLRVHGRYSPERVVELLALVGMPPAAAERRPAEFSGGQRQRIAIARALALEPELLVLDEPVSSLDMSIQAQVINLLKRLQDSLGLTCLFIAHDLSVVRYMSDELAVMYLGRVVETGSCHDVFDTPQHPYTQSLIAAVPVPTPVGREARRVRHLEGELPDPAAPPSGCGFRTRCPRAQTRCAEQDPALAPVGAPGQQAACWFPGPATTSSRQPGPVTA
ncbi:MAG TPA: oligopeptide/dipeptide ABC transporter ATP-binding protein [Mycobacteriales bacterium]|jgi:oligopeptide transport system ATP-binding protein|nr:oligopeptide/dipeptide ABC transporter ATP-binding protein [Mycobacteriales bacterium]